MLSSPRVRLLDVDPDIGNFLTAEELADAHQLAIPVFSVGRDQDGELGELKAYGAFGALVLEGMVLRQLQVGDQLGMRLLGPGDVVSLTDTPPSMLVGESTFRAASGTRLAVLGREMVVAARRWPSLIAGLQARWAQQADRLTTQLVVCQLPRVDQRLLALMWLLAESWGRVTPAGTTLPLRLTHDALGALIGARRPTVTLALRELTERGAIVRQDQGWLLLEAPPQASQAPEIVRPPSPIRELPSAWSQAPQGHTTGVFEKDLSDSYELLKETVASLREQHVKNRERFRARMSTIAIDRERCAEIRQRIEGERMARQQFRSRRPPST